jgi:hypothetical protein
MCRKAFGKPESDRNQDRLPHPLLTCDRVPAKAFLPQAFLRTPSFTLRFWATALLRMLSCERLPATAFLWQAFLRTPFINHPGAVVPVGGLRRFCECPQIFIERVIFTLTTNPGDSS